MGVALDSFVMVLETAGSIAVLALIWSVFTRLRAKSNERGIFQRFPVLLPAVTFVISIIVVGQLGILPIAEYRGTNSLDSTVTSSGNILHFTVYQSHVVYSDNIEMRMDMYLAPSESLNTTIEFYLPDTLVETINVNLTTNGTEEMVSDQRALVLDPGTYTVSINSTFYEDGTPTDISTHWIDFRLSQALKSSFISEMVTWSSMQFGLNVGCFFFILSGFCIGGPAKQRYTEADSSEEPQADFGDGDPEYGKGC
jgi:hypothetical protein